MTKSRKSTTLVHYFSGAALTLAIAGCAFDGMRGRAPEDVVRDRATERLEAFVKGDFERSYGLTTPSYRKVRNLESYRRGFGAQAAWQKAEVLRVNCEPERCKVAIAVNVKPLARGKFGDTITVQFEETWLLEDGNWWLHQGL